MISPGTILILNGASSSGNCVFADHVLVEPAWVADCAQRFANLPAYLVGVRCPLAVLEYRERMRKNRTIIRHLESGEPPKAFQSLNQQK